MRREEVEEMRVKEVEKIMENKNRESEEELWGVEKVLSEGK